MAKRKKQEVKVVPEEKRLQEAMADGTCTIQNEFSMDVIGIPDRRYQGRVEELDAEHSKRFAAMLDSNIVPFPVVVFVSESRCILVDGFHRHDAYRRKGRTSIPAYVFTIPEDQLEHEARLYASMCNQLAIKVRGDNDRRKAVEMLFADPECWLNWNHKRIGDHCGCSPITASRWRLEYSSQKGIPFPETFPDESGRNRQSRYKKRSMVPAVYCDANGTRSARIGGETIYLGHNEESSERKISEIAEELSESRRVLSTAKGLVDFAVARNIHVSRLHAGSTSFGIFGFRSGSCLFVAATGDRAIIWAIGVLHLLRCQIAKSHRVDRPKRYAIICCLGDFPVGLIALVRESGIDVMTPEELVASIQAENEKEAP